MTMIVHPECVGRFFPGDPVTLRDNVDRMLRAAAGQPRCPKAIIVPHAAYDYSGAVAAAAYACLGRGKIQRVVLLGTCHFVRTDGLLTTLADAIATPLGNVPVDTAAVERALELPQVSVDEEAHRADHALAVQLPFLQQVLDELRVVPLLVSGCAAALVAEVLELFWNDAETLIVVSSDLSHFLSYEEARRRDHETAEAIARLDVEAVGRENACGYRAIGGLLLSARRHKLQARQADLRNSGDTAGGRDHVVGYGSFVFEPVDD